jgi:hypothetical protein
MREATVRQIVEGAAAITAGGGSGAKVAVTAREVRTLLALRPAATPR